VTFGRDPDESPVDAGHLAIQELVLRLGRAAGYDGAFELPTRPAEPWRSIDVGLASRAARRMILVECWNTIGDVGAAARSTSRKRSRSRGPRDRAAGRWQSRRGRMGRPVDRSKSCADPPVSRGVHDALSWIVTGMGRCPHQRRHATSRSRPRLERCRLDPALRVAPLRAHRDGRARTPCYTPALTATTGKSSAGTAPSERGMV
jgi:hypothetical protein